MKTYKKSLLEYSDVRSVADCARSEGEARGRKIGREIGKAIAKQEVMMDAYAAGFPLESIAQITKMPIEEVKKIIASRPS